MTPTESELRLALVDDDDLKKLSEPDARREIRRRVRDESLYEPWATCRRAAAPR